MNANTKTKAGTGRDSHGGAGTLTYARWKSMIARCHNPKATNFAYYGARGIAVCPAWRTSFRAFLADMGECPSTDMTVDRIENSLGYEPGNCRWATKAAQNRNRSHCVQLTFGGHTRIVSEWAALIGITPNALSMRLRIGWSVERALSTPPKTHHTQS